MLPTESELGLVQVWRNIRRARMLVIPPDAILAAMSNHGFIQMKLAWCGGSVRNHSWIRCAFV